MTRLTRRHFGFAAAALSLTLAGAGFAAKADDGAIIGVTGAAGQLGGLTVDALLEQVPPERIVALARTPDARSEALAAKGVTVRFADYTDPAALNAALEGVDRLLLVSSTGGNRVTQHGNVIEAAQAQGVQFMAYTGFLHGAASPMPVGADHAATEELLAQSGLRHAVLRNSFYTEAYVNEALNAARNGEIAGAYGEGRIAPATRADLAAATAAVLLNPDMEQDRIYELAGDDSFSMAELAEEVARLTGRDVAYRDLSAGAAGPAAGMQTAIAQGALYDDSRTISRLTGRPTTSWREVIGDALREAGLTQD